MKTTTKKIISVILSVLMLTAYLPTMAFAKTSGDYSYSLDSYGHAEIADANDNISGSVIIPGELDGHTVTSIGDDAFKNCTSMTSVTIPNSVTLIGDSAFEKCSSLTSITITDGVKAIGSSAFVECSLLKSITIPDSVTSIGALSFEYCSSLTNIDVGENNTSFASTDGVLFNKAKTEIICYPASKSATNYKIPDSVTSIGKKSFYDCESLASVIIPDSVNGIGEYAFYSCKSLISINVGKGVTSIGKGAFGECTSLTSMNWNAKSVSDFDSASNVFEGAGTEGTGIEAVFGDNVEKIPANLFYVSNSSFSPKVKSITVGNSVTSIGNYAFRDCTALTRINWNIKTISDFGSSSNIFYNAGTSGTGIEAVFGDNVEKIPANLFYASNSSFFPKITSVKIGNSVTSIENNAFRNCTLLTSITIGTGVSSIGNSAFSTCTSLTSINVDDNNSDYSSQDGILFNKTKTEIMCYPASKSTTSYIIPDSVTSIGDYAFYNCSSLTSITIPDSVTSIGERAFCNCSSLTKLTVSDNVTSIGISAFSGCTSLTSILIGNGVTSIGKEAFAECTSLTSIKWNAKTVSDFSLSSNVFKNAGTKGIGFEVVFGDKVEKIPAYLFYAQESSYIPKVTRVTIGNSVSEIRERAFSACTSLTNITIPNSVKKIGDNSFSGCSSLAELTIPDSVTLIGNYAFYNCKSLTSITIPNSVASIGQYAFNGCSKLQKIYWDSRISYSYWNIFYESGANADGIEVVFGDSITKIPSSLFSDLKVTSIIFGKNINTIGSNAFKGAILTEVIIPKSVTKIESGAFYNCSNLSNIYIMNPACNLGNDDTTINHTAEIHSHSDSTVEAYANKYGFDFEKMHMYSEKWTDSATCTEDGELYHKCEYCDEKTDVSVSKAKGHTVIKDNAVPATCTTDGKTEGSHCSACGAIIEAQKVINSKGHTFGEWTVTTPATTLEYGKETRTCSVCGTKETRIIPKLEITTEPTTKPSTEPTTKPSTEPTTKPSTEPTTKPTTEPTTKPTTEPTTKPTTEPTTKPTTEPTTKPTTEPTTKPSTEPTTKPSTEPTTKPTTEITSEDESAPQKYMLGDVNNDGKVNAADARLALRISANLDVATDIQLLAADIDKNKKISASDARTILRVSAGLENF